MHLQINPSTRDTGPYNSPTCSGGGMGMAIGKHVTKPMCCVLQSLGLGQHDVPSIDKTVAGMNQHVPSYEQARSRAELRARSLKPRRCKRGS